VCLRCVFSVSANPRITVRCNRLEILDGFGSAGVLEANWRGRVIIRGVKDQGLLDRGRERLWPRVCVFQACVF
jgi:hypothetical protein